MKGDAIILLKVIELFSGIGSQRSALDRLGIEHEVVGVSEIDKYAMMSYEAIHGKTHNFGDITKIKQLPQADLWTYSFPCTDISLAGKRQGLQHNNKIENTLFSFDEQPSKPTRSGLLYEVQRLLYNSPKPKYLLLENVKALVGNKFIHDFQGWLDELNMLGYHSYWKVLNAKEYGIPQNRERVFVVSILKEHDNGNFRFPDRFPLKLKLKDMLEEEVDEKYYLSDKMIKYFTTNSSENYNRLEVFMRNFKDKKKVAATITTNTGSRATDNFIMIPEATKQGYALATNGDGVYLNRPHQKRGTVQHEMIPTLTTSTSDLGVIVKNKIRKLTPLECWRLMGFTDEQFTRASQVCSNAQLYKQAGNSIVVDVLYYIFKQLFNV